MCIRDSDITDKVIGYAEIKPKNETKSSGQRVKSLKDMEALKQAMAAQDVKMSDDEKVSINLEKISKELDLGIITLKDIVSELKKPGRDPRDEMPDVVFRNDVLSMEDLKTDMELMGTVRNVIDFGAFVDIGIKNDGLVHISQICDRYISHPSQVLSVGDQVKVKILDIDHGKGRVSLTMKNVTQ